MPRFFKKITARFLMLTNIILLVIYGITCWLAGQDPREWFISGFAPLMLPYLAFIVFCYVILWLAVRPRWSIPSLAVLLIGAALLKSIIPFRLSSEFEQTKTDDQLRVMTWNIRYFTPFRSLYYNPSEGTRFDHIFREVERFQPDIVCLQEFTNDGKERGSDPVHILQRRLGYRYFYFPGDDLNWNTVASGTAIFSKHPILATENIRYDTNRYRDVEHTVGAEILWRGDTLKVYSIHLKSFGFLPNDYHAFQKIRQSEDIGLHASKSLFRKMRQTFIDHAEQSDMIRGHIASTPYPMIICTDLNDVAHSYAYNTLKGDRRDVFIEKGSGLGKTYTSPSSPILGKLPTLRIDHVFTSLRFETVQVTTGNPRLSDHQPVVVDLRLAEKE